MSSSRQGPQFAVTELSPEELSLQAEVRAFLDREIPPGSYRPGLGFGAPADREFSRKLGARGWLGMALPKEYGGGERGAVERFVVTEELLARGAHIGHHWVADRQSGASINAHGTTEQKQRFLPGIAAGELGFSIGMSEPGSGSDLASVRTRATRVEGGWRLDGTKVWTTGAHRNEWMITLCRTSDDATDKRKGLSQFLVDFTMPGVTVNPIPFLDGETDFNEVVLDGVFIPDDLVLGTIGNGWAQNIGELAFERGGPDRFMSPFMVLVEWLREYAPSRGESGELLLGRATATLWSLRNLSLASARAIDNGRQPVVEAALVKEIGTRFELDLIEQLQEVVDLEPSPESSSLFERLLVEAVLTGPAFTIRGGTIEVLRSIVAKGL